jgi:hypothetical protein
MFIGKEFHLAVFSTSILECRLTYCTVHLWKIKQRLIPQVSVVRATSEFERISQLTGAFQVVQYLENTQKAKTSPPAVQCQQLQFAAHLLRAYSPSFVKDNPQSTIVQFLDPPRFDY